MDPILSWGSPTLRPSTDIPLARPLPEAEAPFGPTAPPVSTRVPPAWFRTTSAAFSARRPRVCCTPLPVLGFAALHDAFFRNAPERATGEPTPVPATQGLPPFEEFPPSAAVPRHRDRDRVHRKPLPSCRYRSTPHDDRNRRARTSSPPKRRGCAVSPSRPKPVRRSPPNRRGGGGKRGPRVCLADEAPVRRSGPPLRRPRPGVTEVTPNRIPRSPGAGEPVPCGLRARRAPDDDSSHADRCQPVRSGSIGRSGRLQGLSPLTGPLRPDAVAGTECARSFHGLFSPSRSAASAPYRKNRCARALGRAGRRPSPRRRIVEAGPPASLPRFTRVAPLRAKWTGGSAPLQRRGAEADPTLRPRAGVQGLDAAPRRAFTRRSGCGVRRGSALEVCPEVVAVGPKLH
jgi:hypothetical protein